MKEGKAVLLLLLASFLWGFTFVFQSQASGVVGPFFFNGTRMLIGVVVLIPLLIPMFKRHKGDKAYWKRLAKGGVLCGLAIASASVVQQYGIEYTTAGKAGFITSLYTLIVPVLSLLMGRKVGGRIWGCIGVGLVGTFMLSVNGNDGIGYGDLLVLGSAFLFAVQIMLVDVFVKGLEGVDLSACQFLFGGMFCLVCGFFVEGYTVDSFIGSFADAAVPILYAGICSCGIAYTLQIIGQKWVQPSKATLALSLESAWAAVGGVLVLGETLSAKELAGCALMFCAVVLAQLPCRMKGKS